MRVRNTPDDKDAIIRELARLLFYWIGAFNRESKGYKVNLTTVEHMLKNVKRKVRNRRRLTHG